MPYNRHRQAIRWFALKNKMNENFPGGSGHFFPRGAIVTAFLGENVGYEKSGPRPVLCVSNDTNNRRSGNIAVVPLTDETNKGASLLATQYRLSNTKYKLRLNSIVQCEDVRVISKERVGSVIDFVDAYDMKQISKRLKSFFAI